MEAPELARKCRLCLSKTDDTAVDIFRGDPDKYADQIADMFNIELESRDKWPCMACTECVILLERMKSFKQGIIASHNSLFSEIYRTMLPKPIELPDSDPEEDLVPTSNSANPSVDPELDPVIEDDAPWPDMDDPMDNDAVDSDSASVAAPEAAKKPVSTECKCGECVPSKRSKPVDPSITAAFQRHQTFLCKICNQDLEKYCLLKKHLLKMHPGQIRNYYLCCNIKFSSHLPRLRDHMLTHINPESFACDQCGQKLANAGGLQMHKQKMHEEKRFVCDQCGKAFTYSHQLKNHGDCRKKFNCDVCNKEFVGKTHLEYHVLEYHSGQLNCLCFICGRGFATKKRLDIHILDHGGPHGGNRKKKPKLKN